MNALGVRSFNIVRTAVAGYKPPIALGQPGSQSGSTVSQLGAGGNFYFARYKGWDLQRSEGDPFTPNPNEAVTNGFAGASTSNDVHQFSKLNGIESPALDCSTGVYKLPCRGGYNWRIVVPDGQSAEIDVYNAAYGPDLGAQKNTCENSQNLATCNSNGYHYHEDDVGGGARCNPNCTAAAQKLYNASAYTLLAVPDLFLRGQDTVLTQTIAYPVDATNYDGQAGAGGPGSASTPTYRNVKDNVDITQYYDSFGNPCNMKIYHAWVDIANYDGGNRCGAVGGTGDNLTVNGKQTSLVKRVSACGTPCSANNPGFPGSLGPGTYRLRVDALNFDGTFSTSSTAPMTGRSSKGYAVRAVDAQTGAACSACTVSGWQDMCVYTPLASGTGVVPLFELTQDYAGATIDVDVFDLGDSGGTVDLAILDPSGVVASSGPGTTLAVVNDGINRQGPAVSHQGNQYPIPKPPGPVTKLDFAPDQAGYQAADPNYQNSGSGPEYQGSWIRLSIPIPSNYNPPAYPNDFWSLRYTNTGGASDTFAFTVSARGGPVHLLKS
jgi:hypothetical protein